MSQRGRPFEPGNKFGRGRPRGSRNKVTAQAKELLNEYSMPLMRKAIGEGLQDNTQILRWLLDRILRGHLDGRVNIGSLPTTTVAEISKAAETVLRKVTSGKLAIPDGEGLFNLLDTRRRAIETEELAQRISSLESKL